MAEQITALLGDADAPDRWHYRSLQLLTTGDTTKGGTLADRHKSETPCNRTGLSPLGGQGAVRAWGYYTKPIPRGFPCPAAC
jgi:hypothetical protein